VSVGHTGRGSRVSLAHAAAASIRGAATDQSSPEPLRRGENTQCDSRRVGQGL